MNLLLVNVLLDNRNLDMKGFITKVIVKHCNTNSKEIYSHKE